MCFIIFRPQETFNKHYLTIICGTCVMTTAIAHAAGRTGDVTGQMTQREGRACSREMRGMGAEKGNYFTAGARKHTKNFKHPNVF